ncbi:MAG: hypothetical protein RLZZ507_4088 [Cyanobacteriota bacterium]|jgi:hypothetical protein
MKFRQIAIARSAVPEAITQKYYAIAIAVWRFGRCDQVLGMWRCDSVSAAASSSLFGGLGEVRSLLGDVWEVRSFVEVWGVRSRLGYVWDVR